MFHKHMQNQFHCSPYAGAMLWLSNDAISQAKSYTATSNIWRRSHMLRLVSIEALHSARNICSAHEAWNSSAQCMFMFRVQFVSLSWHSHSSLQQTSRWISLILRTIRNTRSTFHKRWDTKHWRDLTVSWMGRGVSKIKLHKLQYTSWEQKRCLLRRD